MKKFKFKVRMVDTYEKEIEVEGKSLEDAKFELEKGLDECPLDTWSNSLESSETTIVPAGQKWARKCDATGEGMNEGYCFGDGEAYFKYKKDATKYAKEQGYKSLKKAYDDEAYYWTAWEDESDFQYVEVNGELIEIE